MPDNVDAEAGRPNAEPRDRVNPNAVGFKEVLQQELDYVRDRRVSLRQEPFKEPTADLVKATEEARVQASQLAEAQTRLQDLECAARGQDSDAALAEAREQVQSHTLALTQAQAKVLHHTQGDALQQDLCGLTISGGGIRSATFGLGILQGFAAEGFLKRFDYLSTVSGGGFIGGWLTAWVRRSGINEVSKRLRPAWFDQKDSAGYVEPGEVKHLRLYSNYLTPQPSVMSTDGWTLIAIYLRNLLLNQMVFLLGATAVFLALRTVVELFTISHGLVWNTWPPYLLVAISGGVFFYSIYAAICFATELQHDEAPSDKWNGIWRFMAANVLSAVLASMLFVLPDVQKWFSDQLGRTIAEFAFMLAVSHSVLGYFIGSQCQRARDDASKRDSCALKATVTGFVAGGLGGLGMSILLLCLAASPHRVAPMTVFGPPLFLVSFVLGNFLQIGLLGRNLNAYERERWSSLNARLLWFATLWVITMGTCVFGPWVVIRLTDPEVVGPIRAQIIGWLLGGSWIGVTWGALMAGKSPGTGGGKNSYRELITRLGPIVFLVGLMTALAYFFTWLVYDGYALVQYGSVADHGFLMERGKYLTHLEKVQGAVFGILPPFLALLVVAAVCAVLSGVFAKLIGVNTFSLHELYALRLVRCYLGAVRYSERKPGLITNYDQEDDVSLPDLHTKTPPATNSAPASAASERESTQTDGPYHILCGALNRQNLGPTKEDVTEAQRSAERLAFRDRRAESFVFTANYCGSETTKYCASKKFAGKLSLGTAIAVSGAAVSPNSGYHSSPAVTTLLTIFNSRLGAWFGNPGRAKHNVGNPPGWQFIYRELFGNVNAEADYVYVSDGGHFENMGVYELIRRRCRFIVCVDTWADPDMTRENLGRLVRNVRIDFGVRIEIDVEGTRVKDGRCPSHIAVGKILYGDVHGFGTDVRPVFNDPRYHYEANEGILVYMKMGLTGDEPNDLLNYQMENPLFPHDPISDQFFDESQFESYRALGIHSARVLLQGDAQRPGARNAISRHEHNRPLFERIYQRWLPPPPRGLDSHARYNEAYGNILAKLRGDRDLTLLSAELYGDPQGKAAASRAERTVAQQQSERLMVGEMCALLENVWFGIDLERNILHPLHAGWLNVFRNWTASTTFWRHWLDLQREFSPNTIRFMRKMRNGHFNERLDVLKREVTSNPKLGTLSFELKWISEDPRQSDPASELEAVAKISQLLEDAWSQLEFGRMTDDSLRRFWLENVRKWLLQSTTFHARWSSLSTQFAIEVLTEIKGANLP